MSASIPRRLGYSLLALLGAITAAFLLLHVSGDPVALLVPPEATAEDTVRIRQAYGLDRPLVTQYALYLARLARGDLGFSYRHGLPVVELLRERLAATMLLALASLALAVLLGVTLGTIAAAWRGTAIDAIASLAALGGISVPSFWLGLMLIITFGVLLGWLPVSGFGGLRHLIMPSIVLGTSYAAQVSRLMRTGLLDVLTQDYIRTAHAKGLGGRLILVKHALRNAALPVVTFLGVLFGRMLGGAVVVESIFAWPGMGRLAVQAVLARDFPVVQGAVIVAAGLFLLMSFAIDLMCEWIDPRLRTRSLRT